MPTGKSPRGSRRARARTPAAVPSAATLARRLARLEAERAAEIERHARQLAALRRVHDRRLATMMQEIARLRHHEARTEGLLRLVAERDTTLAAQTERIDRLESLLQKRPGVS
jgi:hypothetical protein